MLTQLNASQRYQERNRELINQQSRERYEAKKQMPLAPRVEVANLRRVAFLEALKEADEDVQREIGDMIDAMVVVFMERGNLKEYAARNQATEFIAACVWDKVTGGNRSKRAAAIAATD
jgi:hypothetical protein